MTKRKVIAARTPWQIFAMPLVLGVLSAIGLVAALVGDDLFWDGIGWVGLGIPLLVTGWCLYRSKAAGA